VQSLAKVLKQATLNLPIVVKPVSQGSTIGVTIVRRGSQWKEALALAHRYDPEAMVENYIPGHEATVSILGTAAEGPNVLPAIEIVAPAGVDDIISLVNELRLETRVTAADGWTFEFEAARRTLLVQMQAQTLHGFGLGDHPAATCAAGALVQYLRDTQKADLAHVREIAFRSGADCMVIGPHRSSA